MSNVAWLPGWRTVSDEEMVLRWMRQDELRLALVEFHQAYRHLPLEEYKDKKEMIHKIARQGITLVKKIY